MNEGEEGDKNTATDGGRLIFGIAKCKVVETEHRTQTPEIRDFHCRSQFFTQKKNRSNTSIEVSNICGSAHSQRICMEQHTSQDGLKIRQMPLV